MSCLSNDCLPVAKLFDTGGENRQTHGDKHIQYHQLQWLADAVVFVGFAWFFWLVHCFLFAAYVFLKWSVAGLQF